ncbi:hypothetical protein HDU98_000556 [Podochytrium sp. JEL0797]|nr:hypothetical protein HDU98_000556 [Podochytrium sp. JEL0797]
MAAPTAVDANPNDMMSFMSTPYTNGFFTCFADPVTCCSVYCCSCLMVGATSGKIYKNGQFDVPACLCSGLAAYRIRRHLQNLFGIKESEDARYP